MSQQPHRYHVRMWTVEFWHLRKQFYIFEKYKNKTRILEPYFRNKISIFYYQLSKVCFLTFYNKISSSYQMNYMRMATLAKHSKAPKFPMLLSQIINFFKIVGRTDKTQSAPLALCHCHRPRSAILASNLFDLIWGKKIRHKVIKRAKLKVWLDDLESYELPLQSRGNHPSSTFILGESIFVIK